jgi:hypothetical protein
MRGGDGSKQVRGAYPSHEHQRVVKELSGIAMDTRRSILNGSQVRSAFNSTGTES